MNGFYIFSLLPHILLLKAQSYDSINKRQTASIANIIQSEWVNSMNGRP